MSSYAKNYRCVQSNIVDVAQIWKMFTNSPSSLTFCLLQKNDLSYWTIYSWKGFSIGCPLLLRTNYRCVESLKISVYVAKCVENVHKFNKFTHFLSVTKNDFSWLNNLFMERFRMSTSVKNKLQMCWVTQHQCRRLLENVHKLTYIHFGLLQKMTCHHWTIYSWQSSNSLGCPLMQKTNYRCVQSLNISVDIAKCVENVHKFTQFTHFLQKKRLVLIEQSIHGKVST